MIRPIGRVNCCGAGYVYPASFDRLPFSLPQPNRNSGELRNQMVSAISFIRRSVFRPGYLLERRWYRMLIVWWPALISGLPIPSVVWAHPFGYASGPVNPRHHGKIPHPTQVSASACAFTTIKKSEPPTPCFAQPDWDSVFCAGRRLQFCTPALFDCGAPFRGADDNASTGLCAAPMRDLLRRYARCYPLMKALDLIRLIVSLFPYGWRLALWPSQMLLLLGAHY